MKTFKEYAGERDFIAEVALIMAEENIDPVEFIDNCIQECQPQLFNEAGLMNRMGNWFQKAGEYAAQIPSRVGSYIDQQSAIGGIEVATNFKNAYHYLNNANAVLEKYRKQNPAGDAELIQGVNELAQFVQAAMQKLYNMKKKADRVEGRIKAHTMQNRQSPDWAPPPGSQQAPAPAPANPAPTPAAIPVPGGP